MHFYVGPAARKFLSPVFLTSLLDYSGMVEVGSGTVKPLADAFPSLAVGVSGEVWTEDGDASASNWVSQYLEPEEHFGAGLDLASLLTSLGADSIADDDANCDAEPPERPAQPATPVSPVSPMSSDSSCQRSGSSVPRHQRPSHKRAELKRRGKIKTKLDDLKAEVPKIADKEKQSESVILSEAAEFTKHLKAQCEANRTEAGNLRREIESLSAEIHNFQETLPAAGLTPETKQTQGSLDQMYKDFVASKTKENWKFYIFSFFLKPLFESYKELVSTDSQSTFMQSVADWSQKNLGLTHLRHLILNKMRDITRETDIMTNPESLPQQAMASIGQTPCSGSQSSPLQSQTAPQQGQQTSTIATAVTELGLTSKSLRAPAIRKHSTVQVARTRSPRLRVKPLKQFVPLIPVSDQQSGGTSAVSQAQNFVPVMSPACGQPSVSTHGILARNFGPAVTMLATSQQVVSSAAVSQPEVGFPQVASGIDRRGLNVGRPTAVVAPSNPTTSVAHFITEFDCNKYDFDITDIPLPDLVEVGQPSSQEPVSVRSSLPSIDLTTLPQVISNPSPSHPPSTVLTVNHSSQSALASLLAQPAVSMVLSSSSNQWS